MTYQLTTLKNGLRVATETLPGFESVAVAITVGVGSRYESEAENGLSHLLEHMAFKGTKTRSARDIAEAFDNIGGQLNAYTSMELTVYYAKVLAANLPLAVDILCDIIQHSTLDETELAREKEVIIQEIAMHYDTPEDLIVDHFDSHAFPHQPLGRSILSTQKKIAAYTRYDVARYMQTHYVPERMIISAAGNVDHAHFVSLVEQFFTMPQAPLPASFPKAMYHGGDIRTEQDLEQLHLIIGLPGIAMHDERYYTLQLYVNILGGGMSSRLFQEVREKQGLAYTVYAMGASYEDVGVMSMYAATSPDKAHALSATLCEQVVHMSAGISEVELLRAKNQLKAELLMSRESPQTVATWMGRHLLMYGKYKQVNEITQRINAVTCADILAMACEIKRGKMTLAALGNIQNVESYEKLSAILAQ